MLYDYSYINLGTGIIYTHRKPNSGWGMEAKGRDSKGIQGSFQGDKECLLL